MTPEAALAALRRAGAAGAVLEQRPPRGLSTGVPEPRAGGVRCAVSPEQLIPVLRVARDQVGCDLLSSVTACDDGDHLTLLYHLVRAAAAGGDAELGGFVLLELRVPRGDHPDGPVVPSAVPVYPGANLQEREIFDLIGIRFRGHPNLTRVLTWAGFRGHPLRKDYVDLDNEIPWRLAGLRGPDGSLLTADDARRAEEASSWEPLRADAPLAPAYPEAEAQAGVDEAPGP